MTGKPLLAFASVMAALAAGILTVVVLRSGGNFDDCVLREMKGLPANMLTMVEATCAQRFHKEKKMEGD